MSSCRCRPTRLMALLMLLWFIMMLQAYMHNYNIVYLMIFLTMGLSGAVYLLAHRNVRRITLRFLAQQRIFAGGEGRFNVMVRSDSAEHYALALTPPYHGDLPYLSSDEAQVLPVKREPLGRGVHPLGTISVESYFPLGLFHCSCRYALRDAALRVYPEPKGAPLQRSQAQSAAWSGERDEFDGLRRYQRGDALSLIHWKASARSNELYSKRYLHTVVRPQMAFAYEQAGEGTEERLSQLCLWILECESQHLDYTITLPGKLYSSKEYRHEEILDALALF